MEQAVTGIDDPHAAYEAIAATLERLRAQAAGQGGLLPLPAAELLPQGKAHRGGQHHGERRPGNPVDRRARGQEKLPQ